ncbi:MAG TPA: nitrilase-related carbon-nitrogen hydrolase [Chloroflexia bacterium]|nr:nitrilase-related carbon-nitrogen hydrolase [Chloroflexia bacterium]
MRLTRTLAGLAVAGLSGLLFLLAFPPYNLWPLAFVAFVPAILAQHRIVPRRWSGLAYGVGFGAYWWAVYGPMFSGAVWFMEWSWPVVGAIAALMTMGNRAFHERTGYRWFVLEGAVGWVGIEAIRGLLPVIGTGGFVAYTLWSQHWAIQPVSIFSIYGLSLVIMLVNYALALGAIALVDRRSVRSGDVPARSSPARNWLAGVAVVAAAWAGLSLALLGQGSVPGSSVRVAAIQPTGSSSLLAVKERLFAQTREAAAQGAQLIVWPEGSLTYDPRVRQSEEILALARETGAYLAVGYGVAGPPMRNEMTLVSPEGEFLGAYGKDHPVVWMGEGSSTRGTYPAYATPLGTIGTIICYDLNFTDTSRRVAANGAQIIAAGSHDWALLGRTQYTNLVMRAVENRVALVKADGNYDSAIIDPAGRVVASFAAGTPTSHTLVADVPLGTANSPLIRLGDWMAWVCLAGFAAFAVAGPVSARRAKGAEKPGAQGAQVAGEPVGAS